MASFKERWYTMPRGPDGKRLRVYHDAPFMTLFEVSLHFEGKEIKAVLDKPNPFLKKLAR